MLWIELVSTRAILVPAGTDTRVLLAVAAAGDRSNESGEPVGEDCWAKLEVAKNRERVKAKPCLVFVLAEFSVLAGFSKACAIEKVRRRKLFGAIVLPPVEAELFRSSGIGTGISSLEKVNSEIERKLSRDW